MKVLSISWKLFRIVCIVQLLLVATQLMIYAGRLFMGRTIIFSLIEILVHTLLFLFLYQGLSILNYNYPDTPLSVKQKRQFNILFLLNFLLIAFLFGHVVNQWRLIAPIIGFVSGGFRGYLALCSVFLFTTIIFIFHLIFLAGMYRLRREIYRQTTETWYSQFDENKPGQV